MAVAGTLISGNVICGVARDIGRSNQPMSSIGESSMKIFFLLLGLLLTGCTTHCPSPEKTAGDFYRYYLSAFDQPEKIAWSSADMQHYVAADTLDRLAAIEKLEEQDINESDYFSYGQDYDPAWIKDLSIGQSEIFMGGAKVPVFIGIGSHARKKMTVYMRKENGLWKIYRVRDETGNYEQPIFDAGRLAAAKKHASELPPLKY
ncbi:DUF3828 domain-containing protein [Enterobacteriaceae bacterium 89]|nr:DUF3828 domain-containing protein [Enterobacteriaceae bacterium 89]